MDSKKAIPHLNEQPDGNWSKPANRRSWEAVYSLIVTIALRPV